VSSICVFMFVFVFFFAFVLCQFIRLAGTNNLKEKHNTKQSNLYFDSSEIVNQKISKLIKIRDTTRIQSDMEKSKEAFKEFVSADFPFRTSRAIQQNLPAREKLLQPTNPSKVDNDLFCVPFLLQERSILS